MAYYRVCEICGCTLDPGEQNPCDECASLMESNCKQYESLLDMQEDGQMKIGELIYGIT